MSAAIARHARLESFEALHDLRVGVRRLRTGLRCFRRELGGSISGKTRRQLARQRQVRADDGRDLRVPASRAPVGKEHERKAIACNLHGARRRAV